MPTNRTARRRAAPRFQVTGEVRAAYARGDDDEVRRLLDLRPWQYPTTASPKEKCPYPDKDWWPFAQELWRLLEGKV